MAAPVAQEGESDIRALRPYELTAMIRAELPILESIIKCVATSSARRVHLELTDVECAAFETV